MSGRSELVHADLNLNLCGHCKTNTRRYMPWAPFPHYAVGALTPPTNNGTLPCETSWNMSAMDTMVEDYLNATRLFDAALSPYFQFSQSPCWMWLDGRCDNTPTDPDQLSFPHKIYAAGR